MNTAVKKVAKMKISNVSFDQFTDIDFVPPSTFFIRGATGDYYFIHTSSRSKAQEWVDENFGKGRYTVVASKLQKTKPKNESGAYSCTGTGSRKK